MSMAYEGDRNVYERVRRIDREGMRPNVHWSTPELLNGYAHAGPPKGKFRWRQAEDGDPCFKGHLDVSGASSGSIVCYLPEWFVKLFEGEDASFTRDLETSPSTFSLGRIYVDVDEDSPDYQSVKAFWPVT